MPDKVIQKFLSKDSNKLSTVGAYNEGKGSFVVICDGIEELAGEEVYFLHSWIFEIWHNDYSQKCHQLVIKDKKTGKDHKVPIAKIKKDAIRGASDRPGKEWAVRVSDIMPEPLPKYSEGTFNFSE